MNRLKRRLSAMLDRFFERSIEKRAHQLWGGESDGRTVE